MEQWKQKWASHKSALAMELTAGNCSGSYDDAALILCTVLSTMAAEVWPGKKIDRKRFIQLLTDITPETFHSTRISMPLFLNSPGGRLLLSQASFPIQEYNYKDTIDILNGEETDKTETSILELWPQLSIGELRSFSYASLLYTQLRSGYVHNYQPGEGLIQYPHTQALDWDISYVNLLLPDHSVTRKLHFGITWLCRLTVATAKELDGLSSSLPFPEPQWWIDQSG